MDTIACQKCPDREAPVDNHSRIIAMADAIDKIANNSVTSAKNNYQRYYDIDPPKNGVFIINQHDRKLII